MTHPFDTIKFPVHYDLYNTYALHLREDLTNGQLEELVLNSLANFTSSNTDTMTEQGSTTAAGPKELLGDRNAA